MKATRIALASATAMRITAPDVREIERFHCNRPKAAARESANVHYMADATSPKLRLLSDGAYRRTFYLVKRLETEAGNALDVALQDYDITSGQYLILSLVSREGGRSSAELARRAFVTPQSMNEVIGALEAKGYIKRTENPENRRILQVSLTREGRRLLDRCEKSVDVAEAAFHSVLTPKKLAEFRATLERLLAAARR
jgi:DNA-binding MarR family transcriptional regulator